MLYELSCLNPAFKSALADIVELPRICQALEEPESFLKRMKGKHIALDEIHRLNKHSEILKIAADHYPDIKVIARGSSTLSASSKFSDTLSGRKTGIWLTPMLMGELNNFNHGDFAT